MSFIHNIYFFQSFSVVTQCDTLESLLVMLEYYKKDFQFENCCLKIVLFYMPMQRKPQASLTLT